MISLVDKIRFVERACQQVASEKGIVDGTIRWFCSNTLQLAAEWRDARHQVQWSVSGVFGVDIFWLQVGALGGGSNSQHSTEIALSAMTSEEALLPIVREAFEVVYLWAVGEADVVTR